MNARNDRATQVRRIRQLVDEIDNARRSIAATSRAIEPTLRDASEDDARRDGESGRAHGDA